MLAALFNGSTKAGCLIVWEREQRVQTQEFGWNVKTYTVQKPMMGALAIHGAEEREAAERMHAKPRRRRRCAEVSQVRKLTH